jgi:lysophospholipase L1-like esterase
VGAGGRFEWIYSDGMIARLAILVLALAGVLPASAQTPAPAAAEPARWERDIAAFEAADARAAPPQGGIVFIGSSSVRLWTTLADDFPGLPVVNRGFGGSQLRDVTAYVGRIVRPYRPRQVVIYCGGNDINAGRRADEIVADLRELVRAIHMDAPDAKIAYISIAPNPARWPQIDTVKAANRAIAGWFKSDPRLTFIDVFPHMLGADGLPLPDIFVEDRLHMNANGYAIWKRVVGPYLVRGDTSR